MCAARLAIKVYKYTDPGVYWTVPLLNITFTVEDVCQAICDKLGGDSTVGYILIRRTKRTIGRPKDIVLQKDTLITDIDSAHKKKRKEYILLISELKNEDPIDGGSISASDKEMRKKMRQSVKKLTRISHSLNDSFSHEMMSDSYLTTKYETHKNDEARSPDRSYLYPIASLKRTPTISKLLQEECPVTPPTRLRSSSSAPIPCLTPMAGSPVILVNSPSPTRQGEKDLLFGGGEFIEQLDKDAPVDGEREINIDASNISMAVVDYIDKAPPTASSVPVTSSVLVPASPTPSPRLASYNNTPRQNSPKHSPMQGSPFARRQAPHAKKRLSNPGRGALTSSIKEPALTIVRIFPSDNGDFDGRCWTIAVYPLHTAREACACIETHLALKEYTLTLHMLYEKPGGGEKLDRQLADDDCLLQVKSFLTGGQVPFFFLRTNNLGDVSEISSPTLVHGELIPPDFKRVVDTNSDDPAPSPFAKNTGKRSTRPIFVGEKFVPLGDSPSENNSPEEPVDITQRRDSSGLIELKHSPSLGYICWIKPDEIKKKKKIGEGSYAKVYKGKYKNMTVAIKTLKGALNESQLLSFKKEFEVLSLTSSPYLIHFYGASITEKDDTAMLSMVFAFCEKGSLYKALNTKKLEFNWKILFKWLGQALSGVVLLHNATPPLVHRDLKTGNILLDADDNVKIADLGLARTLTMSHTSSLGHLRGTMAYCSPEILGGKITSAKSDVYSMSIVIWEMITRLLTGKYRAPFHEYPELQFPFQVIIKAHQHSLRPTINPKTPVEFQNLILQCWDPNPDVRPSSTEVLNTVQSIFSKYKANQTEWDNLIEKSDV